MNELEKQEIGNLIDLVATAVGQESKNHKIVMEILDVIREALKSLNQRVVDLENQNIAIQASFALKEAGAK